jgi:hypothetical protein
MGFVARQDLNRAQGAYGEDLAPEVAVVLPAVLEVVAGLPAALAQIVVE